MPSYGLRDWPLPERLPLSDGRIICRDDWPLPSLIDREERPESPLKERIECWLPLLRWLPLLMDREEPSPPRLIDWDDL